MRFIPYKQLNSLIQQETFEPTFSWGLRMAIAATVPVIWGAATDNMVAASWITLTAESICWVELKGSFAQRMRVLIGGILLAIIFATLGSVTQHNLWLSLAAMLVVGFLSGLFKNLGDRGSGLAVTVFVLFIISNSFPLHDDDELRERIFLVTIGGLWNLLIAITTSALIPAQEPYRRTIAMIWKANASLVDSIAKGWDGKGLRSHIRDIYLQEKAVRQALDNSFHFYESMAHQVTKEDGDKYQLAQLRKATALVGTNITAINDELENLKIKDLKPELRMKIFGAMKSLETALERMAVYVILVKSEEELLVSSRMGKLSKSLIMLKDHSLPEDVLVAHSIRRIILLMERIVKLMERSMQRLEAFQNELPIYRSYTLVKTLFILHPKHWWRNLKLLFNLNTLTARHAIRTALAASLALFVAKWFNIDHGYWLPFTVIIVLQPYFGATFKKAIERVIGTVSGGIVGGLLIRLPAGLYAQEFMLFICFLLMVYFIRRSYSIAAFFITVSVVLLFDVEEVINPTLIITRALSTTGGAAIAIFAGFALLPHWDRKYLPRHIFNAIYCNYQYFLATFFSPKQVNWIRNKRNAESKNSNAFESFNRYMQEPALGRKPYIPFYQLITHNVRITRELNNFHLEQENREKNALAAPLTDDEKRKLYHCLEWFNLNIKDINELYGTSLEVQELEALFANIPSLTMSQSLYIDKLLTELKAMHEDLYHLKESGIIA